ncbi:MAG: alpha/beta hydrolase [Gemmatimonadota bacterium]
MTPSGSARSTIGRQRGVAVLAAVALLLFASYGGAASFLWANQGKLIFMPSRVESQTPADLHLDYVDEWLPVAGSKDSFLHGWWLPSVDASAPVLLYLHGSDLNISANLHRAALFHQLGFSVLIVDYRGYGKSSGDAPSEAGVYEDAETMWDYLIHGRHVDAGRVFIYGHSLGGAIAIELAQRHPDAAGLIVESAFTSIADVAALRFWMFPADWIDRLLRERFDSLARIPRVRVPVLFIHGTADVEVPYAMSEQLFAAAREPKWLTLIPGGGHEDDDTVGGIRYTQAVLDFAWTNRHGG